MFCPTNMLLFTLIAAISVVHTTSISREKRQSYPLSYSQTVEAPVVPPLPLPLPLPVAAPLPVPVPVPFGGAGGLLPLLLLASLGGNGGGNNGYGRRRSHNGYGRRYKRESETQLSEAEIFERKHSENEMPETVAVVSESTKMTMPEKPKERENPHVKKHVLKGSLDMHMGEEKLKL
jgi:hypothetical protein